VQQMKWTRMLSPSIFNRESVPTRQRGMSLVELMVSMVIMLIISGAVLAVYTSSRQTVRTQTGLNRMNERFNLLAESVARDVRQAGFGGCPSIGETSKGLREARRDSITSSNAAVTAVFNDRRLLFRVFTNGAANANVDPLATAGTPIIEIRMAAEQGTHLAATMTNGNSNSTPIKLVGRPGFAPGSYPAGTRALISDCKDVFEVDVATVVDQSPNWTMTTAQPIIIGFDTDARVSPVLLVQYFVGLYTPANGRATRAIYRRTTTPGGRTWNTAAPIVLDVTTMTVNLGLDTDEDWDADQTVSWNAVADPNQVVAIQLNYTLNEGEIGGLDSNRGTGTDGTAISRNFSPWISVRGRTI
jgi:type IV pilus assembly protein PilW